MKYFKIEELISMIDSPNREKCLRLLEDNREIIEVSKGSKSKHQSWKGGYLEHIEEVMNLAIVFFESITSLRERLPFTLSDALLVLFLHDIEKPWKEIDRDRFVHEGVKSKDKIMEFRKEMVEKYGLELGDAHWNAIRYCEGEVDGYNPDRRMALKLAAFCHICDFWSARGWHNYPKKEGDSWKNGTFDEA